jgi:hypothetical protein
MSIKIKDGSTICTIREKPLGKLIMSATGLRKIANYLQKKCKTKGDIVCECYVEKWKDKKEIKRTIGVLIPEIRKK